MIYPEKVEIGKLYHHMGLIQVTQNRYISPHIGKVQSGLRNCIYEYEAISEIPFCNVQCMPEGLNVKNPDFVCII